MVVIKHVHIPWISLNPPSKKREKKLCQFSWINPQRVTAAVVSGAMHLGSLLKYTCNPTHTRHVRLIQLKFMLVQNILTQLTKHHHNSSGSSKRADVRQTDTCRYIHVSAKLMLLLLYWDREVFGTQVKFEVHPHIYVNGVKCGFATHFRKWWEDEWLYEGWVNWWDRVVVIYGWVSWKDILLRSSFFEWKRNGLWI